MRSKRNSNRRQRKLKYGGQSAVGIGAIVLFIFALLAGATFIRNERQMQRQSNKKDLEDMVKAAKEVTKDEFDEPANIKKEKEYTEEIKEAISKINSYEPECPKKKRKGERILPGKSNKCEEDSVLKRNYDFVKDRRIKEGLHEGSEEEVTTEEMRKYLIEDEYEKYKNNMGEAGLGKYVLSLKTIEDEGIGDGLYFKEIMEKRAKREQTFRQQAPREIADLLFPED